MYLTLQTFLLKQKLLILVGKDFYLNCSFATKNGLNQRLKNYLSMHVLIARKSIWSAYALKVITNKM